MILLYYWLFGIDHDVMRFGIGDESLQLKRDISNFGDIQSGMILFCASSSPEELVVAFLDRMDFKVGSNI